MNAHKSMDTAKIFSHLVSKARPIHGADVDAAGKRKRAAPIGGEEGDVSAPPKRATAPSKRKSALVRAINKNSRKRR